MIFVADLEVIEEFEAGNRLKWLRKLGKGQFLCPKAGKHERYTLLRSIRLFVHQLCILAKSNARKLVS